MKKRSAAYFKIVVSLNIFLLGSMCALAQQDIFASAEKLFEKGEYYSAAKLYEQYLSPGKKISSENTFKPYFVNHKETAPKPNDPLNLSKASWRVAESYRIINDFADAEKWYRACIEKYPSQFPLVLYRYGICQRATKNYGAAETSLNDFLSSYHSNDQYVEAAKKELLNLSFIRSQLANNHGSSYKITKQLYASEPGCFGAVFFDDSTIVLTSTQTDSTQFSDNKNPYKNRLFNSNDINGIQKSLVPLVIENAEVNMDQGAASFTPDRQKMFFTQWEKKDGKLISAIYLSNKKNTKWSRPVKAGILNMEGYNSMQPFITDDNNHIFFSSDRPGGVGGFDLWYSKFDANGNVSEPINLGKKVNTTADERTPYYSVKEKQLVFSSNGLIGFGGFDLFAANGKDIIDFGEPINMGMPFNSSKDDIYFFARTSGKGKYEAYFSSDRESTCCLELYKIEKTEHHRPISGTLVDCNSSLPLSSGKIYVRSQTQTIIIDSLSTDESGKFIFDVEKQDNLDFIALKDGYDTNKVSISIPNRTVDSFEPDSVQTVLICIKKIPVETNPEMEKEEIKENDIVKSEQEKDLIIYFDFDKNILSSSAKSRLDSIVVMLRKNPATIIQIGGYTDEKGTDEYNLDLGYKRAKATTTYLMAKGISVKQFRLKSYGECCPVNEMNDPHTNDKLSRRVEFIFSPKSN